MCEVDLKWVWLVEPLFKMLAMSLYKAKCRWKGNEDKKKLIETLNYLYNVIVVVGYTTY